MQNHYAQISYHADWTLQLAHDLNAAKYDIHISALSMHTPNRALGTHLARVVQAMLDAPTRGVMVHVYLPAASQSHPATLKNNSTAERLHANNIHAHLIPLPNLLHAKQCAIDDTIGWCGSGNWTQAAAVHNTEAYLRAESTDIAQEIRQAMQALCWQKNKTTPVPA
ncbi:MAG: phospholipase D-like domain-containing protein [Ginsengibacter sp.]